MPVITYTAVNRGFLASGHSAGTQYKIECNLEAFPLDFDPKGEIDEALDGTPEGWLHALQVGYEIQSDLVLLADREKWREFFTSVINTETFTIDFTGTIASPGTNVSVWMPTRRIPEPQIFGIGVKYAFRVKKLP